MKYDTKVTVQPAKGDPYTVPARVTLMDKLRISDGIYVAIRDQVNVTTPKDIDIKENTVIRYRGEEYVVTLATVKKRYRSDRLINTQFEMAKGR